MRKLYLLVLLLAVAALSQPLCGGLLFLGSDAIGTQFAKVVTNGATAGAPTLVNVSGFEINGIGEGSTAGNGLLYTGDPTSNHIRTIDFNGNLINDFTSTFPTGCCGEDMAFNGSILYHVKWTGEIERLNPANGAVMNTYPTPGNNSGPVGIAFVGSTVWITDWAGQTVGTWDTVTYTPMFSTPADAGALAYDAGANVLWVGVGGEAIPYSLTGTVLGPPVDPWGLGLGSCCLDGLAFMSTSVPEPGTYALVFAGLGSLAWFRRRRASR